MVFITFLMKQRLRNETTYVRIVVEKYKQKLNRKYHDSKEAANGGISN